VLLLLDTCVCIDIMRRRSGAVADHLIRAGNAPLVLSSIVLAELEFGQAMTSQAPRGRQQIPELAQRCEIRDFDAAAAAIYGPLRLFLRQQGQEIGPNDLLIAAHALSLDATLITGNLGEFRRVPGLRVESWTMP